MVLAGGRDLYFSRRDPKGTSKENTIFLRMILNVADVFKESNLKAVFMSGHVVIERDA